MIDEFDVDSLSFEQLRALQASAEKALEKQKRIKIESLRSEIEKMLAGNGFTVKEVFADLIPEPPATKMGLRKPATPKFFNPNDPSVTWSGRGKQPHWFQEHIAAGKSVDEVRLPEPKEK
jgi:DNA-binding protein H-NS